MKRIAITATILALAACRAEPPATPPAPPAGNDACGASRLGDMIGQPYTAGWGRIARRRVPATVIRGIGPGDAVTMDYNPMRLNAELDAARKVVAIRCG